MAREERPRGTEFGAACMAMRPGKLTPWKAPPAHRLLEATV